MFGLEIHYLLGIAGIALILVSLVLFFVQQPKGKIATTAGGALGGVLLGGAVGLWVMVQEGWGWDLPDPGAYSNKWLSPEQRTEQGNKGFNASAKMDATMDALRNATMEERGEVFKMRKPGAAPPPAKAPTNKPPADKP